MSVVDSRAELERGRDAYSRRAWVDAYEALSRVDGAATLDLDNLQLLATSAEMTGRVDEYQSLLERLHRAHLAGGEGLRAARDAFWLGMTLATQGEIGPAGG